MNYKVTDDAGLTASYSPEKLLELLAKVTYDQSREGERKGLKELIEALASTLSTNQFILTARPIDLMLLSAGISFYYARFIEKNKVEIITEEIKEKETNGN
jgi:hypothetical protein